MQIRPCQKRKVTYQMSVIRLFYYSYTGNVRNFAHNLYRYSFQRYFLNKEPIIVTKEINDKTNFNVERNPFFICLPTYLIYEDQMYKESLTTPMRRFLQFANNANQCLGIVGNGDRGYLDQYCLTARLYEKIFDVPLVSDFEQRGTKQDVEKIYNVLMNYSENNKNIG